jgi:hypothetical protein
MMLVMDNWRVVAEAMAVIPITVMVGGVAEEVAEAVAQDVDRHIQVEND